MKELLLNRRKLLQGAAATAAMSTIPIQARANPVFASAAFWAEGARLNWLDYKPGSVLVAFDKKDTTVSDYYQLYTAVYNSSYTTAQHVTPLPNIPSATIPYHYGNPAYDPTGLWMAFQAASPTLSSYPGLMGVATPGLGVANDLFIYNVKNSATNPPTNITNFTFNYTVTDGYRTALKGVLNPHFGHVVDDSGCTPLIWAQRVGDLAGTSNGKWVIAYATFDTTTGALKTGSTISYYAPCSGIAPGFYETQGFASDDSAFYFNYSTDYNPGDNEPGILLNYCTYKMAVSTMTATPITNYTDLTNPPEASNYWAEHAIPQGPNSDGSLGPNVAFMYDQSSYSSGGTGFPISGSPLTTEFWTFSTSAGANFQQQTGFNDSTCSYYVSNLLVGPDNNQTPTGATASALSWCPDNTTPMFLGAVKFWNDDSEIDEQIWLISGLQNLTS